MRQVTSACSLAAHTTTCQCDVGVHVQASCASVVHTFKLGAANFVQT